MFKSLGKFFKNLLTGAKGVVSSIRGNNHALKASEATTTLESIRSGNGHISHFTWSNKAHEQNKKKKNRVRNKMARASRNAQHKMAA